MTLEARVEVLENDVFQIRKMVHSMDDEKHRTWCDLQEQLLQEVHENGLRLNRLEDGVHILKEGQKQLETRMNQLETRMHQIEAELRTVKTDIGEIKLMLKSLIDRQ